MKRYDKQDLDCISHMFDIKELMRSYKWAEDDINDIRKYMQAITEQVQIALKAEQVHFITIRREQNRWSTDKKVYYYVSIKTEIHIDGVKQNASTPYIAEFEKLNKKFGGMEKKEAATYVELLRKKYNFKIKKEGFVKL